MKINRATRCTHPVALSVVAAAFTLTACVSHVSRTPEPCNRYPLTAAVYDVAGSTVTVETSCGDLFSFCTDTPSEYCLGALLTLQMDNNGTRGDVTDDRILSASISGFSV